ncbi:hypothetical protein D3C71_21090 [compost metagenome]
MSLYSTVCAYLILCACLAAWHLAETLQMKLPQALKGAALATFMLSALPATHLVLTQGARPLATMGLFLLWAVAQAAVAGARAR